MYTPNWYFGLIPFEKVNDESIPKFFAKGNMTVASPVSIPERSAPNISSYQKYYTPLQNSH